MAHLMIDLETLALTPDAVVMQLGWATFTRQEGILKSGNLFIDPAEQIVRKRRIEWQAIQWWMQQDEAARSAFASRYSKSVQEQLSFFINWISWSQIEGVWSHGAGFDIPIMEDLCRSYGYKVPWSYKIVRDTRTLFMLAEGGFEWAPNDTAHNAEADAKCQALTVIAAMKALKEIDHAHS